VPIGLVSEQHAYIKNTYSTQRNNGILSQTLIIFAYFLMKRYHLMPVSSLTAIYKIPMNLASNHI